MTSCPACGSSSRPDTVICLRDAPASLVNLQNNASKSIGQKRYDIKIVACPVCTHLWNALFVDDPDLYTGAGCKMYNAGSGWQEHLQKVRGLVNENCDLLIDIGAGDGSFLASIPTPFNRKAYEPSDSYHECVKNANAGMKAYNKYFVFKDDIPPEGSITIMMRHLIEHFEYPREFLGNLAQACRDRHDGTVRVIIEVPNIQNALDKVRLEDWTYEHAQHFTAKSLTRLLYSLGGWYIQVSTSYNNEVLIAEVYFPTHVNKQPDYRNAVLRAHSNMPTEDVAYWGGAGKGATFLNMFDICGPVVDSDPGKVGYYVPGTDSVIHSPEILIHNPVSTIIATTSWRANDIRDEINSSSIPCKRLLKFENGHIVEVPLG